MSRSGEAPNVASSTTSSSVAHTDTLSSIRSVHTLVAQKKLAEWKLQERLKRAEESKKRRRGEEDDEEDDENEEEETKQSLSAIESRTRLQLRDAAATVAASTPLINPLSLLPTAPRAPQVQLGANAVSASGAWSFELAEVARKADQEAEQVEWEEEETPAESPTLIQHSSSSAANNASTQPLDDEDDAGFSMNDEVLFGEEAPIDDQNVAMPEEEEVKMDESDAGASSNAAASSITVDPSLGLNKVVLAPPAAILPADATATAASSLAASGGSIDISFSSLTSEQVAQHVKQLKADVKAGKQKEKEAKETSKPKGKRKSSAKEELMGSATKRQKKSASTGDEPSSAAASSSSTKKKKEKATSLVPAQRITKATRELMVHIQHVHLISLISLIQYQSHPSLGIMNDMLLQAQVLSLVLGKCPGITMKQWKVDPRKGATWIGAKRSTSSTKTKGKTWKSSQLPATAAASASSSSSPLAAAAASSSSSSPQAGIIDLDDDVEDGEPSTSALPPPVEGTIFSRVQKLAYWFRSYYTCHADRIESCAQDKTHPLHAYDTNLHMRMLNEVRCTCVRKRLIRAMVRGQKNNKMNLNPWYHYKQCLRSQFTRTLQTREGSFQTLTMLFVMMMRSIGVLTRLCYGIPAVKYSKDLVLPKASEEGEAAMKSIVVDGNGQFGVTNLNGNNPVHSMLSTLLREQTSAKQDPRLLNVLNTAVKEKCQCEKPFQPVKQDGEGEDDNVASAASSSSTPMKKTQSSPASVTRTSTSFLGKHEVVEILDSDEEMEDESKKKEQPKQTRKAADFIRSPKSDAAASSNEQMAATSSDFASAPPKPSRKKSVAKKLDVAPSASTSKRTRSTLVNLDEEMKESSGKAEESAAASSSASSVTTRKPTRTVRSKSVVYVESDEDKEIDEEEEEEAESNPCTVCGSESSTDEATNPILLCDECDAAICFKCIDPPLDAIPGEKDEYLCAKCEAKKSKPKRGASTAKGKPRAKASKKKSKEEDEDGDVEMIDVDADEEKDEKETKQKAASTKKPRAPRKPRAKKGDAAAAAASNDIDLTTSAPNSPSQSTKKPKAKKRTLTGVLARAFDSNAPPASPNHPQLIPEPTDLSDAESTPPKMKRAVSSTTPAAAAAASSAKLPKKQYFEHGYPLIWCEFYCPEERRWVHVDVMRHLFDSEGVYEHDGGIAWQYVIAVRPSMDSGAHLLTDVTKRYTRKWIAIVQNRSDEGWFIHQLQRMSGQCAAIDRDIENHDHAELEARHNVVLDEMPTRLNEFKTHPLYCIDKFTKKYELIHPSGQQHSKGVFIEKKKATADEPAGEIVHLVYPRSSLHVLHTADRWRREQRAVKQEELLYPLKTCKKLVQMSRAQKEEKIRLGLYNPEGEKSDLYAIFQTEPWLPEAAQNGIVPKNERGHVDVWGEEHIPPGCVHLPHPRLKQICKKLQIDFAEAMTGFDVKGGRSVPRFEGVVVCQEFAEKVMKAYREAEAAAVQRAEKRRMDAIIKNWRRLVRGSIVRERVMREVMKKSEDTELAFIPGSTQPAAAAPRSSSKSASSSSEVAASSSSSSATPYGALAASLHAAASAPLYPQTDTTHEHVYSNRTFDQETNAWTSVCACGKRQTFEEL